MSAPERVWTLGEVVDLCRDSFVETVAYVFAWRRFRLAGVHRRMARFLQVSPKRRKSLLAARGFNKTTIVQIYVAWRLLRDPTLKCMILSATLRHAKKFIKGLRSILIQCPIFRHLRPRGRAENTKTQFDVAGIVPDTDASVAAYGVETQITGTHVGLIVTDDVEIPENSDSADKREDLNELIDELEAILNPGGEWVNIGTYQHVDSVHQRFEVATYWDLLRIPALNADGESNYPERFPTQALRELESRVSKAFWRLQILLDRNLDDLDIYPVKLGNIVRNPMERIPLDLFLDPSGCTGNDEVGYCAAGVAGERRELIYYQEIGGLLGDVDPIAEELCRVVESYAIALIWYESNMPGSRHFVDVLRRHLYARRLRPAFRPHPVKGNKHARIINVLEPLSESKQLAMHPAVLEDPRTVEQFRGLTYQDLPDPCDRIDVTSFAAEILSARTAPAGSLYPAPDDEDFDDEDLEEARSMARRSRVSMLRR